GAGGPQSSLAEPVEASAGALRQAQGAGGAQSSLAEPVEASAGALRQAQGAGGAQSSLAEPVEASAAVEDDVVDDIGGKWTLESGQTVEQRLATIVGESMGYDADDLPREVPLIELGLDSLMAVRIKNRVEYEFDIPQLQLQAMRQANLGDVTKFVTFAVQNRDQVDLLAQGSPDGKELDTAALSALIDEANARNAAGEPFDGAQGADDVAAVDAAAPEIVADEPSSSVVEPGDEGARVETTPSGEPAAVPKKADLTDQAQVAAAAGADVPPRDAAERLTFGAYAVVTGKSAGGVFNKLDVLDQEIAQKLTDRLNDRTGGNIDVEDVIASETIEELSEYVRKHMEAAADIDGFVRYLRVPEVDGKRQHVFDTTAGDPIPMLVFHPAGGNTSAYEALLKRLPEDQPVVGFDRVEGSIEERVRQYLPKLKEVAPHGPYVLVGWSLGGVLAYGAAQLLRDQGEQIALVGLIDVVRPTVDLIDTPENKRARLERWKDFAVKTYDLDESIPIPMDRLVDADDDGQFQIIMEMIQASGTKIPGGIIEHQRTSFVDNRALSNIAPTRYDGNVVLYRADKMHDGAIELEPQWADVAPDGRWGEVVDDLEIVQIGGDHLSIVDEPYVAKVAADLSRRIADVNQKEV
ncbi:MAG: non-ribosomal peptide synthetase, partial [Gordonia sp. (in: high G+C Gram-positive bacteria)]|uniref:thioesterase domain-containing protein n=1 Tax=Gordonia sp. (in: high G+C Gram-positive bacteria) TaxID=84139 RepID=UPI003BB62B16